MTSKHSPAILLSLLVPIPVWAGQLLINGGFETGNLDGWTVTAGSAIVVEQSATDFFNPNEPRSGDWMISSSDADINNPGNQVSYEQTVTIGGGAPACAKIMAGVYFAGESANGVSSDDLAQIEIRFLGGNVALGTVSTAAIDPLLGSWNELRLDNILVPAGTDTIVFNVNTFLDPGFHSIDILGDDFELTLVAADDGGPSTNPCGAADYEIPQSKARFASVTLDEILDVVSEATGIRRHEIAAAADRNTRSIRAMAMLLCRQHGGFALRDIGDAFGIARYTTVASAISRCRDKAAGDADFARQLAALTQRIRKMRNA